MATAHDWKKMFTVDAEGCWNWTGVIDENGRACWGGRAAHRRVYKILRGEIEGVLHHRCENRRCVNPDHMKVVANQSAHMALHPDNAGQFQKGQESWHAGKQLREGQFVVSGKQRRYLTTLICDGCGTVFQRVEEKEPRGQRIFCTRRCYWDHKGPDHNPRTRRRS